MSSSVEIDLRELASGLLSGANKARITEAQLVEVLDAIGIQELKLAVVEEWVSRKEMAARSKGEAIKLLQNLSRIQKKAP